MATFKGKLVLKAVKKIAVQFCPFQSNVRSTREFLAVVGNEKIRATNANCELTTQVKHDGSEPLVDVTFVDGERLVMKGSRLSGCEMLTALHSRCQDKDPHSQQSVSK